MSASPRSWRDDMLLVWDVRGTEPVNEDETIAIEPDGTAWLWTRVPADPARADVVGSFRTGPDPERADRARAVLDGLSTLDDAPSNPHRGTIAIHAAGRTRTTALHGPTGAAAEAVAFGRELARVAFGEPLAAVRFSARLHPGLDLSGLAGADAELLPELLRPGPSGNSLLLNLTVTGLGRGSTDLLLAADRLQAHWQAGDRPVGWAELPAPGVGLNVRAIGDGIRMPAEIEPGTTASLTVRADPPDEPADGVVVRVAGKLRLVGPWESLGIPEAAFEARTRPTGMSEPTD